MGLPLLPSLDPALVMTMTDSEAAEGLEVITIMIEVTTTTEEATTISTETGLTEAVTMAMTEVTTRGAVVTTISTTGTGNTEAERPSRELDVSPPTSEGDRCISPVTSG